MLACPWRQPCWWRGTPLSCHRSAAAHRSQRDYVLRLAASVCMYVALEALEAQLRLRGHSAALQYIVKAARARRLLPLLSLQLSVIRPQRIGLAHSPRRPMRTEALKKQKTYCCNYCHGEAKRSKTTYYIYFTSATPVTTPRTAYLLRLLRVSI